MKVKSNCFELLLAKFYLLTNKQTDLNNNMEILYKIFYIDKERFADIIDATLNTTENLSENIKIFNNFWKSVNDYYPNEKLFKKETIFKMIKKIKILHFVTYLKLGLIKQIKISVKLLILY